MSDYSLGLCCQRFLSRYPCPPKLPLNIGYKGLIWGKVIIIPQSKKSARMQSGSKYSEWYWGELHGNHLGWKPRVVKKESSGSMLRMKPLGWKRMQVPSWALKVSWSNTNKCNLFPSYQPSPKNNDTKTSYYLWKLSLYLKLVSN